MSRPASAAPAKSYTLGVTVVDKSGLNNSAAVTVNVGQSALVAAIDGGDRNVGVSEVLTLDAGATYDPDVPDGASTGLLFAWSCEVLVGPGTCGGVLNATVSNDQVGGKLASNRSRRRLSFDG